MSITRVVAGLALALTVVWLVPAAAPPRAFPIAKWIDELASEDETTWRAASEKLWKAGEDALPALRRASKSTDADLLLRARVILSRIEWGIRPGTPAVVVAEIERYRDGNLASKKAAVAALIKQGRAGVDALRLLLDRENSAEDRKEVLAVLKQNVHITTRERIVAGDLDGADALLEIAAAGGEVDALSNLAAFRAMLGTASASARRLETFAAKGDRGAAKQAAYLYRAAGDLKSASRAAEKTNDPDLLGYLLEEAEEYAALAKLAPPAFTKRPATLAALRWYAGDRKGFDEARKEIPEKDSWERVELTFYSGRASAGIEITRKKDGNSLTVCRLLQVQGRRREALALTLPDNQEQAGWLLLQQIEVAGEMGERDLARKLFAQVLPIVEKFSATSDSLLGGLMRAGNRSGLRAEALAAIGQIIDKVRRDQPASYVFYRMSPNYSGQMSLWWKFLRKHDSGAQPSAILTRLDDWFVHGKPGKDLDAILTAAEAFGDLTDDEKKQWPLALARACERVSKPDKAEAILKKSASDKAESSNHAALGYFYFERRKWGEAATAYEKALKREPTAVQPMYFRGVALLRAGKAKEGKALMTTARLLILGEESPRYELAEELSKRGMQPESLAEAELLVRTAPFQSVLINNICFDLAQGAEQKGDYALAARYYRRPMAHKAFGSGGAFIDDGAYLRVPAWAHQSTARALLEAGKLDAALDRARLAWSCLPEEGDLTIPLIRAFDKARRTKDADRIFAERYGILRKACVEAPRSSACNNRIAWLSACCGRHLDEALRHAVAATQASPQSAGVYDTLAEVRFQRGDRAGALAAIKRAIELARPGQPYFAAQLKRIEAGDREAALPREVHE